MAAFAAMLAVALCALLFPPTTYAASTAAPQNQSKMATDAPSVTECSSKDPASEFKEIMDLCNDTYHISMKLLEELNNTGSFQDESDETPMCYLHCIFDKYGLVDEAGAFDAKGVKEMYHASMEEGTHKAQMDDMVDMCIMQRDERNICRRVYGFTSCLMTEEIIRFGTPMTKKTQPK